MDHEGLGRDLELLAQHVAEAAGARRRVRILARVGLQHGQEFLVVLGREARVHRDHVGHVGQVGDGLEVLDRVVRQLGVAGRVHGHGRDRRDADGVAVGRGLGDGVGADRTAPAGAVFHHHRLAQDAAHLVRRATADDVGGAAGGERNDQADRLGGVALGLRRGGGGRQGQGQCEFASLHEIMSPVINPGRVRPGSKKTVAVPQVGRCGGSVIWVSRPAGRA